ncbi:Protein numb, partial [Fragariocoptes setiger]
MSSSSFNMSRLRRSLRESFRRKRSSTSETNNHRQKQVDEIAVRNGTCMFPVKYLGCVEVFDHRGMQICEEALNKLRNSKTKSIRGTLLVSGDCLRVVDGETKGLIVDQTIEKVSFCSPDRAHEKGFAYICRDAATRRWMCHGFHAIATTGERLSHAVGCAFNVCMERKERREEEAAKAASHSRQPTPSPFKVQSSSPDSPSSKVQTFISKGSFRQTSMTNRLQDPQTCILSDPPPIKHVVNPYAIDRPHAPPLMLQRQTSFRPLSCLKASPFKRQLSLRVSELPSSIQSRQSFNRDFI